jgi:hypothetical protein
MALGKNLKLSKEKLISDVESSPEKTSGTRSKKESGTSSKTAVMDDPQASAASKESAAEAQAASIRKTVAGKAKIRCCQTIRSI